MGHARPCCDSGSRFSVPDYTPPTFLAGYKWVFMSEVIDAFGIGNAIVDVLAHCDDALIKRIGVAKGSMPLIDTAPAEELYTAMGPAIEISGGCAANTAVGVAS